MNYFRSLRPHALCMVNGHDGFFRASGRRRRRTMTATSVAANDNIKGHVLHEGPAYSLALNKDRTQVVVAGRNGNVQQIYISINPRRCVSITPRSRGICFCSCCSAQSVSHRTWLLQRVGQLAVRQNVQCTELVQYGRRLESVRR